MQYLEEIQAQIKTRHLSKILQLWEEYCNDDRVDPQEFIDILKAFKSSDLAKTLGRFVDKALPLWGTVEDKEQSYVILKYLLDLQTTNSEQFAELALKALSERFPNNNKEKNNEWLRLVGLTQKTNFQSAISSYELLAHMLKGNFVFHIGGWGVGEIVDVSELRQQVTIEFENVVGLKHLTFVSAFKVLEPMSPDHFLVKRFAFADELENQSMQDPVSTIKLLLSNLGPKNAGEIKELLFDLVIPEKSWNRWWQNARSKLKRDPFITTPDHLRDPFLLRKEAITAEEHIQQVKDAQKDAITTLRTAYNVMRDLAEDGHNRQVVKDSLITSVHQLLALPELAPAQRLEATLLLETSFELAMEPTSQQMIAELDFRRLKEMIKGMDIVALRKRACQEVKNLRSDWPSLFLDLLGEMQQGMLRDYLFKELNKEQTHSLLEKKLREVLAKPERYSDLLVWYFQKIVAHRDSDLPFSDKQGQCLFFEAFLILYNILENDPTAKELLKKMYMILSGKRYAIVRQVIEGTTLEFIKEFLLLVAKCQTLSDHDLKIMRSLSEVIHPDLSEKKRRKDTHLDGRILWATEEGFAKMQERARHVATVELVQVAKEIEAAREMGDLRENSEYKFAQERRARLQHELKGISDQIKRSRIITQADVSHDQVDIGSIVDLEDSKGKKSSYTILGPWEADPDRNILSFQSKLAQAMLELHADDFFTFREEEYKVCALKTIFDKPKQG